MFEELYKNGTIRLRVLYNQDGIADGKFEGWHKNGKLQQQKFYRNGKLEGECKIWHENGQLWLREFYSNGKTDGECETWGQNGQLRQRQFWKNDELKKNELWLNGHLESRLTRTDMSQKLEEFRKNGRISICRISTGRVEEVINWRENGHINSRSHFRKDDDRTEGEYISWDINGKIWDHRFYRDGRMVDYFFTPKKKRGLLLIKRILRKDTTYKTSFVIIKDLIQIIHNFIPS